MVKLCMVSGHLMDANVGSESRFVRRLQKFVHVACLVVDGRMVLSWRAIIPAS